MGGWEILIALFGGTWYIVSAIAAAKEKKKKQALRREAMATETETLPPPVEAPPQLERPSLPEKSAGISMIETPGEPRPSQATLRTGADDPGIVKQARKAILDSMRKELGLSPSKPTTGPAAPPPGSVTPSGLMVPTSGPMPPPASQPLAPTSKPPVRRRRDRPAPSQPVATSRRSRQGARRSTQLTGTGLQALLKTRLGLKQAIVMAEVLKPPVSMRPDHLAN